MVKLQNSLALPLFSSILFLGTTFFLVPFVFAQEIPQVPPADGTTVPPETFTTPAGDTTTSGAESGTGVTTDTTTSGTSTTADGTTSSTTTDVSGTGATADATATPADPATEEVVTPVVATSLEQDLEYYTKYTLFLKWEKKELYKKYVRYRELSSKYNWEASSKNLKKIKKSLQKDYKKYKKSPRKYSHLATRASDYQNFDSLRAEYFAMKPYAGYGSYIQFDKALYDEYKNYGTAEYKAGYERYQAAITAGTVTAPKETDIDSSALGKNITVGIYNYVPTDLKTGTFKIKANYGFQVLSKNDNFVATLPAGVRAVVKYLGNKEFQISREDTGEILGVKTSEVRFVPVAGHETDTVFDITRPGSSFDKYRDGIRLRYYDSPVADGDRIWVINVLPLEHYVWGMGEITGTGPAEYNRVMTTIYRTYGYWKVLYSTKYAAMGFKVDATSGSQIYYGYDWEVTHDNIKQAAEITRGRIITYNNEPALTPYSSWTDGKTRRYEDGHWGHNCDKSSSKTSDIYPWLSEAGDSWGKHPTLSTCDLANQGNHMVGLSAHGALNRAKEGISYLDILTHYYKGVAVNPLY